MVILALVMAILFIGSKIVIGTPASDDMIFVDLRTMEELRQETQRLEREVRMRQSEADMGTIRNAVSNLGADLNDDRNTDMAAMRERVAGNDATMRGNRDAWEKGLGEIEAIGKGDRDGGGDKGERNAGGDSRAKGRVMVEFSLVDPTRSRVELPTPGYKCERFGSVVVDITVNRNGEVVAAKVNGALSDSDPCMEETALTFAKKSRFNIDLSAPERHTGTITYTFIAQ